MSSSPPVAGVMLAVPEKKTSSVDLYRPLRNYIATAFSEGDAQNAHDDLTALRDRRTAVDRPPLPDTASLEQRRDALAAYARALAAVEPRFPISPDPGHVRAVSFTWFDAFKPGKRTSAPSIHLERAAVLFNLGAVHSQIAVSVDRASANGIKAACNGFQAAAGAFVFLRESGLAARAAAVAGATPDVSPECATMLEKLMLAQAQECFFEKAIGDSRPPALCSKIARQLAQFYEEAYSALNGPVLSQHIDKSWAQHIQLKSAQFYAEASYQYSLDLHEKEEIAEEIARLKVGVSALADAKKVIRGVAAQLMDAVNRLEANMNRNLDIAMKENDRVYLMRVPAASSLGALPGASLVKPIPLDDALDASKEGLFSALVPDGSMKEVSKYTEMVDSIIRTQAEKLQQASELTRVRLKEMELPESIFALEGQVTLPAALKEDADAVQISGGPSGLHSDLDQLKDFRRVNQDLLVQIEELLQKEADEDEQYRGQFGSRWTRPQSGTLTKNVQDRLSKFAANMKQAADSDAKIEQAIRDNYALMSILDQRPIEAALPTIARPMMSLDGNEDAIVGGLKQSLSQLEDIGRQRAGLEDMLKEMKSKDNILPKLMYSSGSHEYLFKKEIAKYDPICAEIAANIDAQEKLLMQIQSQNERFASVFNLENYRVARDNCYQQISAAVKKYREIKANINEGIQFYISMQDAINTLKQQCSDFVMTRNMQCRDMINEVQKKVAGFKLPFNWNSGKKDGASDSKTTGSAQGSAPPPPQAGYPPPPQGPAAPSQLGYPQQPPQQGPAPPLGYPAHPQGSAYPGYPQQPPPQGSVPPHPSYYQQPYYPTPPTQQQQPSYQPPPTGQFQQPPPVANYGNPAYPGWQGPYYNMQQAAPALQPGQYPQQPGQYPSQPTYPSTASYPNPQQGGQ